MENQLRDLEHGSALEKTQQEFQSNQLKTMDYQEFRRKLAGLTDPNRKIGASEKTNVKQTAIRLCSIFADLFGDTLDRKTLWERIGSALQTSCAKVSDDDIDRFISLCLNHIQSDDSKSAASKPLLQTIMEIDSRPTEWKFAFLDYINTHRVPLLVHARSRWEKVKNKEIEL